MAVSDWSTTASSNSSVGGISIAEGMSRASVNNAIRGLMAEVAEVKGALTAEYWPALTADGTTNDASVLQASIDAAELAGGGIVKCPSGKSIAITSGLTIQAAGVILDLNGSTLVADFSSGVAVTVGDGASVFDNIGVRNGRITTSDPSTSLNGVLYKKNVRRRVAHENLRVTSFKGYGIKFEELNWSIQNGFAPLIEACGTNLIIDKNGNAITIAGIGLDGADNYNVQIRGGVGITFVGGYIQFASGGGVLLDTDTVTSTQECAGISFFGTYFEGNGTSHIVGNDGRGLAVNGCFMNCNSMSAAAIKLTNWDGAEIHGNTPSNLSSGTARDFVEADSTSTLINVGYQAVTTIADTRVCYIGGSTLGLIGAGTNSVATLPTASALNRGSFILKDGAGTGADRTTPWMCVDNASASRQFRRVQLSKRKQSAGSQASPYTPTLATVDMFDITVPNTGLTINAPTGAYDDGDEITFLLKQDGTGGGAITWNAAYATDLSNTGTTANYYASVTFAWSAGRSRWVQTGKLEWKA